MYYYSAFGLQIASEPELPGLIPGSGNPEITIRFGEVPMHLSGELKGKGVAYEVANDQFLLRVPGVARFLVSSGKEMIIEREKASDDIDISLFTINTPIGALLYQRGFLPMHASAVELGGRCVLFAGVSGSGKSTILAALHQHGYHMVADEICVISLSGDGMPQVHPGVGYTWLWRNTLDHFGKDTASLKHRPNNPEKYKICIEERFYQMNLPLKAVYILNSGKYQGIEMKEIRGNEKFRQIMYNAYRYRIGNIIHNPAVFFRLRASIGNQAMIKGVYRPEGSRNIDILRDFIINDLEKK